MSDKGEGGHVLPAQPQQSLRISDEAAARLLFSSKSDIGYRLFDGITIFGVVARQSLFPGVVFRRCVLKNCDFSRSDFEGARFEKCVLIDVNLGYTDIRSVQFVDSEIIGCSLANAYIADCNFRRCIVDNINFDASTLLRNAFDDTQICDVSNQTATILHTDFVRSEINGLRLGDCTVLYTIFDRCKFRRFSINSDSLGLTFGLTRSDLDSIGFIFLGDDQQVPEGMHPALALIESFRARRWMVHSAIATLCFSDIPAVDGWRMVSEVLAGQIEGRRGLNMDDVQFLLRIMNNAEARSALPYAAPIYAFDRIGRVTIEDHDAVTERKAVNFLRDELTLMLSRMQVKLHALTEFLAGVDGESNVSCEFRFHAKPDASPEAFLVGSAVMVGSSIHLLEARNGSWIQPIETTAKGLLTILVSLYLLEGCIIQLTHIRARTDVLLSLEMPKGYLEEARKPQQEVPQVIQDILRSLYKGYLSGSVSAPAKAAGLNAEQLEEVQISYLDEAASASPSRK